MGATLGVRLYQPETEDWPAFSGLLGTDQVRRSWLGIRLGELYCDPCASNDYAEWASASDFILAANITVEVQTGGSIGRFFPNSGTLKISKAGAPGYHAVPALQIYTRECYRVLTCGISTDSPGSKNSFRIRLGPGGVDRSGLGIDRSGLGIDRSGLGIDRSGLGIDRSGLGIDRSGSGIDRALIP